MMDDLIEKQTGLESAEIVQNMKAKLVQFSCINKPKDTQQQGARWMPWSKTPMKDVLGDDTLREAAKKL